MVVHDTRYSCRLLPSEAAIRRNAEFRQKLLGQREPLFEGRHVVNEAEKHARAVKPKRSQWPVEFLFQRVQRRYVNPVHPALGFRDGGVGQRDRLAERIRRKPRPAAEGAEAEVDARFRPPARLR